MLKIAHYVCVLQAFGRGYSERCHCQKCFKARKTTTETFGDKEVVFSCEKRESEMLQTCVLADIFVK